jgi:ectoine hydroxylase-related dioxygenase (phytanoyl-CoA dioxygenase family)
MSTELITDDQVAIFQEDGAVPLYNVFDEKWLALLREGTEQAIAERGPLSKDYAKPGEGSFFTDHHMHRRIEAFRRFTFGSPAAALAARLLGAKRLNLFDEHLLVKEPGTENPTYWHQDLPYYEFAGDQICSLWIPLDPATAENGTLKFVKGSHLWGKLYRPIRIGLGELVEEAEELDGPAPDIDADPDKYDIAQYDLQPGDCVAFHAAVLHGASPNRSQTKRRRAVAVRFTGDDVVWNPRPYIPSVPDAPDLTPGGPVECDLYPRIWTAGD